MMMREPEQATDIRRWIYTSAPSRWTAGGGICLRGTSGLIVRVLESTASSACVRAAACIIQHCETVPPAGSHNFK
jgi:hypothetical protein